MRPFKLTLGPSQPANHAVRHANDTVSEILIDFREDEGASAGFLSIFCDIVSGKPKWWCVCDENGDRLPGVDRFFLSEKDALAAVHSFVDNLLN